MTPAPRIEMIIFVGVLFYVLIPGIGAFAVRKQWRLFRKRVVDAASLPVLSYRTLYERSGHAEREIGQFQFFGALEAIEEDDLIWLRSGGLTVSVRMLDLRVYLLPSEEFGVTLDSTNEELPERTPSLLKWRRMSSLTEGSKIYVAGEVSYSKGRAVFHATRTQSLLVVMYDGPEETVVRRSIWCGRQRNEYWNQLTPMSLAGGMLALTVLAYLTMRPPVLTSVAVFAALGAVLPVLTLAPPGVFLFFLYRRLWKEGRYRRATRDLKLLEHQEASALEYASRMGRDAALLELLSLLSFIVGLSANAVLGVALISYLL